MNQHSTIAAETPPGVRTTDSAEGFSAIAASGTAAVIWRRAPIPGFQAWIDALDPDQLPSARVVLDPQRLPAAVAAACEAAHMPAGTERDWLTQDIARLAEAFLAHVPAPLLRLRLDVVTSNACRRFHIDAVTARLICTYRGTGTQYGRAAQGADPATIFTVPTGAPVILRGTLWPEGPGAELVHRSPPIEGTGQTRLMLVLDPVVDAEDL